MSNWFKWKYAGTGGAVEEGRFLLRDLIAFAPRGNTVDVYLRGGHVLRIPRVELESLVDTVGKWEREPD